MSWGCRPGRGCRPSRRAAGVWEGALTLRHSMSREPADDGLAPHAAASRARAAVAITAATVRVAAASRCRSARVPSSWLETSRSGMNRAGLRGRQDSRLLARGKQPRSRPAPPCRACARCYPAGRQPSAARRASARRRAGRAGAADSAQQRHSSPHLILAARAQRRADSGSGQSWRASAMNAWNRGKCPPR